jgi:hypothetical protein
MRRFATGPRLEAREVKGPWLGSRRGYLSDWVTQRWVQLSGRRVQLADHPWLEGPTGSPTGIGDDFYERLAEQLGLEVVQHEGQGLMPSLAVLSGPGIDPGAVDPRIVDFYQQTSRYRLDAWSHWCGAFRPFGWLLAIIFSRRLRQLNLPLSPLDTSKGFSSRVVALVDPGSGEVRHTGWIRELLASRQVVYVGDYSTCSIPGAPGRCVKVVFPLPNGSATVILRPEVLTDRSLRLHSSGRRFGDPGFYFIVRDGADAWVRYLPTLRELIHVYVENEELQTDHVFWIWGIKYLQLHYRLRPS